jgi:hypothetical protein
MRKPVPLDLIQLYSASSTEKWNAWLTERLQMRDLEGLVEMRRRLQAGMDHLVKTKLSTNKLEVWFVRMNSSIEKTMRRIWRIKYPNPCDNPLIAQQNIEHLPRKRRRDAKFAKFLKDTSY